MKITDFLTAGAILPELLSHDKEAVLEEMASCFESCYPELDKAKVLQVLTERERISTTAIGDGVAIPHGKLVHAQRIFGIFARSPAGVDFSSLDGEPTHLFFVLIAPEGAAADHLKALARISRILKDDTFRSRLLTCQDGQELYTIIAAEDDKF